MNAEQCIANQILNLLLHSNMFSPVNAKQCMGNQIKTGYYMLPLFIVLLVIELCFVVL